MSWRKWVSRSGKSAPQKCQIKGTIRQAIQELLNMLEPVKGHLFRASWNRNMFDYMRKNMQVRHVVQIFDFSMNFRNINQDEVQSAYWDGSQTTIHAVINYFLCPNEGCTESVTLILGQISADLLHDSFVARAGHDAAFRYLAEIGVQMDSVFQFSDNCSAQYKSRWPFTEMARSSLNITRVYFGEKHGKNQCDGFFGRLKAWMTYKIKTRQFIITSANDFFRCCQQEYETGIPEPGTCQHYRVVFQFLRPSDIRRHQDCDLDRGIEGTCHMYSVKNTVNPLELKVRNTPCLCPACITENGQACENAMYSDEWRDVQLKPVRGKSKKTHMKRKHPKDYVSAQKQVIPSREEELGSDDEILPDMVLDNVVLQDEEPVVVENAEPVVDLTEKDGKEEDTLIDLTEGAGGHENDFIEIPSEPTDMNDILITCDESENMSLEIDPKLMQSFVQEDYIPDRIYWESILGSFERCTSDLEFEHTAIEISKQLKPLRARKQNVQFRVAVDFIDAVALESIPQDGRKNVLAVKTSPDGNCMCRSLSYAYSGDENMHLELLARIIIEGVLRKNHYMCDEGLRRGEQHRRDESLAHLYVKYSDHYLNGQKITQKTVEYIYCRELHDCSRINSYMGLWQLAQAALVLNIPIRSVYPEGGDPIM